MNVKNDFFVISTFEGGQERYAEKIIADALVLGWEIAGCPGVSTGSKRDFRVALLHPEKLKEAREMYRRQLVDRLVCV